MQNIQFYRRIRFSLLFKLVKIKWFFSGPYWLANIHSSLFSYIVYKEALSGCDRAVITWGACSVLSELDWLHTLSFAYFLFQNSANRGQIQMLSAAFPKTKVCSTLSFPGGQNCCKTFVLFFLSTSVSQYVKYSPVCPLDIGYHCMKWKCLYSLQLSVEYYLKRPFWKDNKWLF